MPYRLSSKDFASLIRRLLQKISDYAERVGAALWLAANGVPLEAMDQLIPETIQHSPEKTTQKSSRPFKIHSLQPYFPRELPVVSEITPEENPHDELVQTRQQRASLVDRIMAMSSALDGVGARPEGEEILDLASTEFLMIAAALDLSSKTEARILRERKQWLTSQQSSTTTGTLTLDKATTDTGMIRRIRQQNPETGSTVVIDPRRQKN